ncbi:MAG: GH-E family nuclease [Planctomycetota bacterium]
MYSRERFNQLVRDEQVIRWPERFVRPKRSWTKSERKTVWENAAKESPDGIVRDPLTKRPIQFSDPWEFGHKPQYEFWKHRRSARQRGISEAEFLEEYKKLHQYRPETKATNQGRKAEDTTDAYDGPP